MMDLKKCRTCFTDLDANDLFLKLDVIHKNSKLTLAEKLKLCVPEMDLKYSDKLHICMQCSMHLETAFIFRTTCLKTEDEFKKYVSHALPSTQNLRSMRKKHVEEEKKKESDLMLCHTCNINFSSKNIFDLHMRVMHSINNKTNEESLERLAPEKSTEEKDKQLNGLKVAMKKSNQKEKSKNTRPLLQMVVLQTNIGSSLVDDSKKKCNKKENKRKRTKEELKKIQEITAKNLKRDGQGRFLKMKPKVKQTKHKKVNVKPSLNAVKVKSRTISENKKLNISLHKTNNSLLNCRFCSKQFLVQASLTRHLITFHKDKCTCCSICQRYFTNAKEHKKRYGCKSKGIPKNYSDTTKQIPTNYSDTTKQIPTNYSDSTKRIPQNYSHSTKSTYQFSENTEFCFMYSGSKYPTCLICKKQYHFQYDLKEHILKVHKDTISCKTCCRTFSAFDYTFHLSIGCEKKQCFNYTSDGECICPVCNKILGNRSKLFGHFSQHSKEKLQCKICQTVFKKMRAFGEHVVLGCEKTKTQDEKNSVVYIKVDEGSISSLQSLKQSSVQNNPPETEINISSLSTYNQSHCLNSSAMDTCSTISDTGLNRNIKVEPTVLLDPNIFMMNESACAVPDIDVQFDNEDITDSPELVYIVSGNSGAD